MNLIVFLIISTMAVLTNTSSTGSTDDVLHRNQKIKFEPCFVGEASALSVPIPMSETAHSGDPSKSFAAFLRSPDSNRALLGGKIRKLEELSEHGSDVWECVQESVHWFGLTITPSVIIRVDRGGLDSNTVTTSVLSTKTDVIGFFGRSAASVVQRASTNGGTTFRWVEDKASGSYLLDAHFELNIHVDTYVPARIKSIGSKHVTRTSEKKLTEIVQVLCDSYAEWSKGRNH